MISAPEKRYCWTCKRLITPVWWERHMGSLWHLRCVLEGPPPTSGSTRETRKGASPLNDDDDDDDDEADDGDKPDTRSQCGGCSRRITSGFEYHLDDGRAYHNNCVPFATTRTLNCPQTAQGISQQAEKFLAGELGTGRPQNA